MRISFEDLHHFVVLRTPEGDTVVITSSLRGKGESGAPPAARTPAGLHGPTVGAGTGNPSQGNSAGE